MSSRSATVLVIFSVAVIAFCLASVFASMTGPISILPNESESGGILDNLSVLTDSEDNNYQSYGYDDSQESSSSSDSSQSSEQQIETTTDDSQENPSSSQQSDAPVETTVDENPNSDNPKNSK